MSHIKTRWADKIDIEKPLAEYPRPQLVRNDWQCLNGKFDFTVTSKTEEIPRNFDSEIIVPFAPETYLSGIERTVEPDEYIWYRKKFILDDCFEGKRTLLHFEAVDWRCMVYVNEKPVGTHQGGYLPFSFDITEYLREGFNELIVRVFDPTETGWQDRGKQVRNSTGFWYTATSGIWQTVWLEPVAEKHIKNLKLTPDLDCSEIRIETEISYGEETNLRAIIKEGDNIVFAGKIEKDKTVKLKNVRTWSPEDPFLYDIVIALCDEDEKILDVVSSYFGMRKFSIGYDDKAVPRLYLNNKPYFQTGLLDQGYWPDGGMTPPCDEAMIFDIREMKNLGFNMLRKHIKVEPRRWYYHCDRLGMIVWQDMVCGAKKIDMFFVGVLPNLFIRSVSDKHYKWFGVDNEECRTEHENSVYETIDHLYNCTSIGCWVPFNESWGQFDAKRIGETVKEYDPTRIVDHASGWHDQKGPELKSVHQYILPFIPPRGDGRPLVLSEFGGYSRIIENHVWNRAKSFGYVMFKTKKSLTMAYKRLFEKQIIPNIRRGLSATVYTQVSDVEFEVNGIYTYDRELLKINADTIREINAKLKY